mgnify:CR=1 FL=1
MKTVFHAGGKIVTSIVMTLTATLMSFASADVNIYSYREESLIKPLLDAFTA